jgi:hypothetical protein
MRAGYAMGFSANSAFFRQPVEYVTVVFKSGLVVVQAPGLKFLELIYINTTA